MPNTNSLATAARTLRAARRRLSDAMQSAEAATNEAHINGVPEAEIARTLGVNRTTVRKWLGK